MKEKGRNFHENFSRRTRNCAISRMPITRCTGQTYRRDKTLRGKVGRNSSWQIVKTSSPQHKGNHYYP